MALLAYVNKGDAILAQQYNNLVDAIGGPTNPSNNMPFTLTKNGIVFNSGIEKYETKAAAQIPAFLEVKATTGQVGEGYSIYNAQDVAANRFEGVYANVGSPANFSELCWNCLNGAKSSTAQLVIIDPTTNEPTIIRYNEPLQLSLPSGILPICRRQENAGFALVQVTAASNNEYHQIGYVYAFIGNFEKFGATLGFGNRADLVPRQNWITVIKTLDSTVEDARLIFHQTVWKATLWFGGDSFPKLTYTIGTQNVLMLPDAYVSKGDSIGGAYDPLRLSTYLSSVDIIPNKQLGFDDVWSTNTLQLFNFDKKDSTAENLSTIIESNLLSSYDVLVKHKGPHPKAADDPTFDTLCSAVLEYMPISSLMGSSNHTGDANLSSHHLSSVYLSSDGQYQLYNFDKDGISYPYEGYVNDFEVVVRELYTSQHNGSQINYLPLSSFNLPGDTNITDYSRRKSIELLNNVGTKYYELYNFHDLGNAITSFESPNGFDVVVRDYSFPGEFPHISYVRLSALNTAISGDTNVLEGATHQSSIETILSGDLKWHQLYRWCENDGEINCTVPADGQDHYLANEGETYPGAKRFLMCDDTTRQLEYRDIVVNIPKIRMQDLDDTTITSIVNVISGDLSVDVSAIISASLSAGDDRYWIKGEDNTENYGSSIGNSSKTQVIDLDNKQLNCLTSIEHWSTGSLYADYDLKAQNVEATYLLKIGNTTLNETQLQQLLALLNAPQRLQNL